MEKGFNCLRLSCLKYWWGLGMSSKKYSDTKPSSIKMGIITAAPNRGCVPCKKQCKAGLCPYVLALSKLRLIYLCRGRQSWGKSLLGGTWMWQISSTTMISSKARWWKSRLAPFLLQKSRSQHLQPVEWRPVSAQSAWLTNCVLTVVFCI